MYERKILPFYMTYPLPLYYQEEDTILKDLEYLQQMYPADARKYQKKIAEILDKLDYEGSMIYDEFPDRWQLYKLSSDILDRIRREEEKNESKKCIQKNGRTGTRSSYDRRHMDRIRTAGKGSSKGQLSGGKGQLRQELYA